MIFCTTPGRATRNTSTRRVTKGKNGGITPHEATKGKNGDITPHEAEALTKKGLRAAA